MNARARLRQDLLRLRNERAGMTVVNALHRLEWTLKYSPGQPRVPGGSPEGGRWTSGGGPQAGPNDGGAPPADADVYGLADSSFGDSADKAPRVDVETTPDGALYTTTAPDGTRITFTTEGDTQTIRDGDGNIIGRATWTPRGPEEEPIVQPAQWQAVVPLVRQAAPYVAAGAAAVYNYLAARNGEAERAVLSFFRSWDHQATATNSIAFVDTLSREEVESACPKLPVVQSFTDDAAARLKLSDYSSPATYGTAVHKAVKNAIEKENDPTLRAEISALKSLEEAAAAGDFGALYGQRGSVRIDRTGERWERHHLRV